MNVIRYKKSGRPRKACDLLYWLDKSNYHVPPFLKIFKVVIYQAQGTVTAKQVCLDARDN